MANTGKETPSTISGQKVLALSDISSKPNSLAAVLAKAPKLEPKHIQFKDWKLLDFGEFKSFFPWIVRHGLETLNFNCRCGERWTWGVNPYEGRGKLGPSPVIQRVIVGEKGKPGCLLKAVCTCGNIHWKPYYGPHDQGIKRRTNDNVHG